MSGIQSAERLWRATPQRKSNIFEFRTIPLRSFVCELAEAVFKRYRQAAATAEGRASPVTIFWHHT